MTQLTLAVAIKEGRLEEFVSQAEAYGIGPISEAAFNDTASTVIRTPLSDDQILGDCIFDKPKARAG